MTRVGAMVMLAGLTVWLIGTPYFFLMNRHHLNYCGHPVHRSMTLFFTCGIAGPLLVAAGLGLTHHRRSAPARLAVVLATLVGLCAVGLVALEQASEAVGVAGSLVRCDG